MAFMIALINKSPGDLQRMLDKLHSWCRRWRVLINTNKSKCIYLHKTRSRVTNFEFTIGLNKFEIVDDYKYSLIKTTNKPIKLLESNLQYDKTSYFNVDTTSDF
jgi:hypothetical protein